MAFGFLRAMGRGFKAFFGGIFRSEMAKFVLKYERTFSQVIIDVAKGTLESDNNKRQEAFAKLVSVFKGVPGGFRDHWISWGIETVLAKLKNEGKV